MACRTLGAGVGCLRGGGGLRDVTVDQQERALGTQAGNPQGQGHIRQRRSAAWGEHGGSGSGLFLQPPPEYSIEYHPYDILFQEERHWLFSTLDGEITEYGWKDPPEGTRHIYIPADGEPVEKPVGRVPFVRHGVLEIKTASPNGKASWAEWEGKVPGHYYAQLCHQLLATGYDFAVLQAALWTRSGDIILREYHFERADCEADISWLLSQEEEFWMSVQTGKRPGAPIRF